MSDNLTIGQRIALLRKQKGLTQEGLGSLTSKTRSAIAQIESNAMRPDYEFIKEIVRICNTTYEYIFGDSLDPGGPPKNQNSNAHKNPPTGVRYSDEKGGKVRGKVSDFEENQMYIKRPVEHRLSGVSDEEASKIQKKSYEAIQRRIQADRQRLINLVGEADADSSSDWAFLVQTLQDTQQEVLRILITRITHLEQDLQDLKKHFDPPKK